MSNDSHEFNAVPDCQRVTQTSRVGQTAQSERLGRIERVDRRVSRELGDSDEAELNNPDDS